MLQCVGLLLYSHATTVGDGYHYYTLERMRLPISSRDTVYYMLERHHLLLSLLRALLVKTTNTTTWLWHRLLILVPYRYHA